VEPSEVTIEIRPGYAAIRLPTSIGTDVGGGKDVGEGQAIRDASKAVTAREHFDDLEAATPVAQELVAHTNPGIHAQLARSYLVTFRRRDQAGLLMSVTHLHLPADLRDFDTGGKTL
jgi:hypothetical protein